MVKNTDMKPIIEAICKINVLENLSAAHPVKGEQTNCTKPFNPVKLPTMKFEWFEMMYMYDDITFPSKIAREN